VIAMTCLPNEKVSKQNTNTSNSLIDAILHLMDEIFL
jgi:hypothetical protein